MKKKKKKKKRHGTVNNSKSEILRMTHSGIFNENQYSQFKSPSQLRIIKNQGEILNGRQNAKPPTNAIYN